MSPNGKRRLSQRIIAESLIETFKPPLFGDPYEEINIYESSEEEEGGENNGSDSSPNTPKLPILDPNSVRKKGGGARRAYYIRKERQQPSIKQHRILELNKLKERGDRRHELE